MNSEREQADSRIDGMVDASTHDLAQDALLDALPASIALLDANGVIQKVNNSWRIFGCENDYRHPAHGIGSSYLDACDHAVGDGEEDARSVAAGIRAVLEGNEAMFSYEYPCHTKEEQRWFRMMVTPMPADGGKGAVVMHFNITSRRMAEDTARENEERLQRQRDALIALTSTGIADSIDPYEAFRQITETAGRTLDVSRTSIWRYNKDRNAIHCIDLFDRNSNAHTSGFVLAAENYPAYFKALAREDVIAADHAETHSATHEFAESYLRPLGITSMLDAAVRVAGKVEGVLCHEHVGMARKWTTDESAFAVSMANLVNVTLEGWERRVTLEVVLKVAQAVSTGKVTEFFDLLTRNIIESLDADCAVIGRIDRANPMVCKTLSIASKSRQIENREFPLINSASEGVSLGYASIIERHARARFPDDALLRELSLDSYVGIPLFAQDGSACGIMAVMFARPLEQIALVHSVLKIFATRAAAELGRQEADARIHEQASLLDKAQDAILVRDLNHRITYWNKSAERLYGWTAEEAIGRHVADMLHQEPSQFEAASAALLADGEWTGELIQMSKGGDEVLVEGRWTLVRDDHGQPVSILAINTDITAKKRIEAQFLRAQRLESIGTLAGGVAHDLNNMLAPIMMAVDLLRLSVTEKHALSIISTIDLSARRGAEMVRQVLSFARGVEGQRILLDPKDVLRDIEQIIRDSFPKNIEFHSVVPRTTLHFAADPTQVHQVMLNLCVNARDAMPAGGRLTITIGWLTVDEAYATMIANAKIGDYVSFTVADTGTGMPQKVLEKIFDPFFTTKELGSGTGLGLSTVLGIVNSHGGFIDVASEPRRGSAFTIFFPAGESQSADDLTNGEDESLPRGHGELILIVDDEEAVREITSDTLQTFGYQTLLAHDGAEAIAIYAQRQQDLAVVLTDMMMPVMDGPTAIQVLKRMNPDVRILAASGLTNSGGAASLDALGVTEFLPKPYTARTLLTALQRILRA